MKLFLALLLSVASAAVLHTSNRDIGPDLLPGIYQRIRAIPEKAGCPQNISLSNYTHTDRGVSVPHQVLKVNGNNCTGSGEITTSPADHAFENPVYDPLRRKEPFLDSAMRDLVIAKGTFVGISVDPMTCGEHNLPKNTVYAFVYNHDRNISILANRLLFPSGRRHMVMFIESVGTPIVCAYDAPPSATPTVNSSKPVNSVSHSKVSPASSSIASVLNSTEPSPEASPESPSPSPACFPGGSTVELESGVWKRMHELQLGDRVRVAATQFSPVFMFTHRLPKVSATFLEFRTASGRSLTVTPGHLLYVDGMLVSARSVTIGSVLSTETGARDIVRGVKRVEDVGLYNPQTVHGDIIVDGLRASTYTTAVRPLPAHALLAPLRALYGALGVSSSALDGGADGLLRFGVGYGLS